MTVIAAILAIAIVVCLTALVIGGTIWCLFKIAGSIGLKEAARKAQPTIKEPIMAVEIVTPEEFLGDCIGDLNSRRGRIEGMEPGPGGTQVIRAQVPLSEMFGYATDVRSNTQGLATYTMQFERYEEVPPNIAEKVVGGEQDAA